MENKINIGDVIFWLIIIALMSLSVYALFKGTLW